MRCCWTDVSDCTVCEKLVNCNIGNEYIRLREQTQKPAEPLIDEKPVVTSLSYPQKIVKVILDEDEK